MNLDQAILKAFQSIYSDPSNRDQYGQVGIINYREAVLKDLLSEEAIEHLNSGKCKYGRLMTYGNSSFTYRSVSPTSDFYSDLRLIAKAETIISSNPAKLF